MEKSFTTGYINAGGRGTRLNELFKPDPNTGVAKALLEIGSPPVKLIDHHIANFRQQNIDEVTVAAGDQIEVYEYLMDSYHRDPLLHVTRSYDQLGTGGDIISYARTLSNDENLLVQNVDTILDIDLISFSEHSKLMSKIGAVACIALTANKNVPNEGAYIVDSDSKVVSSAEFTDTSAIKVTELGYSRTSSTGAVVVEPRFLRNQDWSERDGQISLYSNLLRSAWQAGHLYSYDNGDNFFRDVGTVDSWLESQQDVALQEQLRYNNHEN